MRDKIFYTLCFGFLFGVLLRSFISVNLYLIILIAIISLALLLFFSLISKNKWGIIFLVFILAFCFGIFRFHMVDAPPMGVFESKYGEKVKVYTVGSGENIVSREICGGPHVERTGVLGKFKITKEESSSSGVRRIKAILE